MPPIFKHAAADGIGQVRCQQPLAEADIVLAGPRAHRLARDAKLGAAGHAHLGGQRDAGEEVGKGPGVDVLGVGDAVGVGHGLGVGDGTNLDGAAEDPGAAQVDVALLLEVGDAEALEQLQGVVVGVVVVPLEALGVVEEDVGGEGVVAIDDVSGKRTGTRISAGRGRGGGCFSP